jgi:hypothetical protein
VRVGLDDPDEWDNLSITCEINPPVQGVNRRVAGAFLRGSDESLALGHSGKIGGGRKGIGQTALLADARSKKALVLFADGQTSTMLIVGAVNSSKFRAEVGYFVRDVQRVKALLTGEISAPPTVEDTFKPEFFGKKKPFSGPLEIEAVATHGLVVGALADALHALGKTPHNDLYRDLYLGAGDSGDVLRGVNYFCRSATTISAGEGAAKGVSLRTQVHSVS